MESIKRGDLGMERPREGNLFNPRHWTLFCHVNFALSMLLLVDWILGVLIPIIHRPSYLSLLYSAGDSLPALISFISIVVVLVFSPLFNDRLDRSPFFVAIIISALLELSVNQYTLLGVITGRALSLTCSAVMVLFSINMILLENEGPLDVVQVLGIGTCFLLVNLVLNVSFLELGIAEVWGIFFFLIAFLGTWMIYLERERLGAIPIFMACVLNDYAFPFSLGGFNAGVELLKIFSFFLILREFIQK